MRVLQIDNVPVMMDIMIITQINGVKLNNSN